MDSVPVALESAIRTRLRERQVRGLAVCGFDRDGVRFSGGFGDADIGRGEPVTPATVFRVASISKLLTTALVLRLVDSGDLDLDAPANRYLEPELQIAERDGGPAPSPLRTLLSHTSGLPFGVRGTDLGNPILSYVLNRGRVRSLAQAIEGLRLTRGPGERIVYSNPAFNVVGHIAARVLGVPFEVAARDTVLDPLGMADSGFDQRPSGPGVATPYGSILPPGPGAKPVDGMRLVATPMGGLTSTVEDLARFGRMVLNRGRVGGRAVLSAESVEAATSMEATNHPDLEQGYGLGFKVRPWRGRTVVGHDGNMPGVATQLLLSPEDGVGIVVLTNGFDLGVPHGIAAMGLEHLVGPAARPTAGSAGPSEQVRGEDREALGRRLEGSYRLRDATPAGLIGRLTDRMTRIEATHEADGRMRIDRNPGAGGSMWLHPDGDLGHFRLAAQVGDGTNGVLEERGDGVHLWLGYTTHLVRT